MPFNCSKCGICCQIVGLSVEKAKQNLQYSAIMQEVASFPHKYDSTGRCEKLSLDNQCTIYETRPDMCNVEVFHKKHFPEFTETEFFKLNEEGCKIIQKNEHARNL